MINNRQNILKVFAASVVLLLSISCEKKSEDDPGEGEAVLDTAGDYVAGQIKQSRGGATGGTFQEIPNVSSDLGYRVALYLGGVDTFKITIEGCVSGYAASLDQLSSSASLYVGDQGCLAKLTEFSFQSKTYTPETGFEFVTFAQGEFATFLSGDGLDRFQVEILGQISSPSQSSDTIDFKFFQIIDSLVTINILDVAPGNTDSIGPVVPDFSVFKTELIDTVAAQDAAKIILSMECDSALTNSGIPALAACNSVLLSDLEYVFISDIYSGQPCTEGTISSCDSIMSANSPKVVDPTTADLVIPGTGGLVNGGFDTKQTLATALITPDNMSLNPNFIFMVRNTQSNSYRIFNLDLNVDYVVGAPDFYFVDLANEAQDDFVNVSDSLIANDLVANVQGINYSVSDYALVASATTCDGGLTYGAAVPKNSSADFGSDGAYKVCVRLSTGGAEAPAYGASFIINYDSISPQFTSLPLSGDAAGGYINLVESVLTNDLVGAAVGSGFDTEAYKLVSIGDICDGSLVYSATIPKSNSTDFAGDGDYKICVQLTDLAQNPTVYGESSTITLKTTPPVLTSIVLANETIDGYINLGEYTSSNVLINVSASGFSVDDFTLPLINSPAVTCDGSKTFDQLERPSILSIPAVDGAYVICLRLVDFAGNTVYGISPELVRDITPPSGVVLADQPDGVEIATFNWSQASETGSGFDEYYFELDDNSDFSSPYYTQSVSSIATVSHQVLSGMLEGVNYWRLTAIDLAGSRQVYLPTDPDFNVTLQPPVLTNITDRLETVNPLLTTDTLDFDINNENIFSDINVTYTCLFDRLIDGAVASGSNCNTISGIFSFDTATALFSWMPDAADYGSYEFKVTGTNSFGSDTEIIGIHVQQPYDKTGRLIDVQATFADSLNPGASTLATWDDLALPANNGSLSNFAFNASSGWQGVGSQLEPYRLLFDGVDDNVDFGTAMSGQTDFSLSAWIAPKNAASQAGEILIAVGPNDSDDGFRVKQSDVTANTLKLQIGKSYTQMVLADAADFLWMFDDLTASTVAVDLGPNAYNGSYVGGVSHEVTGIMVESGKMTAEFVGLDTQRIGIPDTALINKGAFPERSYELWFTADNTVKRQILYEEGSGIKGYVIYIENDQIYVSGYATNSFGYVYESNSVSSGELNHVVLIYDSTDRVKGYLNGVRFTNTSNGAGAGSIGTHGKIGVGGSNGNPKFVDQSRTCDLVVAHGLNCPFDGKIQGLAIYNSLVSEAAILKHYYTGSQICETTGLTNDEWVNLAASYSTSVSPPVAKMFINGIEVCSVVTSSSFIPGSQSLVLGAADVSGANAWSGAISALRVYTSALSATLISSYVESSPTFFDTIPPAFISLNGSNEALDGHINSVELNSSGEMFSLVATGYTSVFYTEILTAPQVCDISQTYGSVSIPAIVSLPTVDGDYVICVKLEDNDANITYGESVLIKRDTVDPVLISFTGANEAVDTYVDLTETGSAFSIVSLFSIGYSEAFYSGILDNSPSQTCDANQNYENISAPAINSMPPFDDVYVVCVKILDDAGNFIYGISEVITRDAAPPPVFTSIDLANDAIDMNIGISDHLLSNPLIDNLQASNYEVVRYLLVVEAVICDGSLTYGNIPMSNDVRFTSDGNYKVCIELTAAGEVPDFGESPSITYDTVYPNGISLVDQVDGNEHPMLNWTQASDSGTGFKQYILEVDNDSDFSSITYTQVITLISTISYTTSALPADLYYWRVRVSDNADNDLIIMPNDIDFLVTPAPPVLTTVADFSFPSNHYTEGVSAAVLNLDNTNSGSDVDISYTCVFDRVVDGVVAGFIDCTDLPGVASYDINTAVFDWTPGEDVFGTFEIKFIGSNAGGSDTEIFTIAVQRSYFTSGRVLDFDAQFANLSSAGTGALSVWSDISGLSAAGNLTSFGYDASSGWKGDGTRGNTFALEFDGIDDVVDFDTALTGSSADMFGLWIKPKSSASTNGETLITAGFSENSDGFKVIQSTENANRLRFKVGKSYENIILADNPDFYWRLNDAGASVGDSGPNSNDGIYIGSPLQQRQSLVVENSDTSVEFVGNSSQGIEIPDHPQLNTGTFGSRSIELWFRVNDVVNRQILYEEGGGTAGHAIYVEGGNVYVNSRNSSSSTRYKFEAITVGTIYHLVLVWNANAGGGSIDPPVEGYLNGMKFSNDGDVSAPVSIGSHSGNIGIGLADGNPRFHDGSRTCNGSNSLGNKCPLDGFVDEISIYNSLLSQQQIQNHYYAGVHFVNQLT